MAVSQVKPIYLLRGGDEFLRDYHRRDIVHRAIGDADPQTCVSQFDSDAELADVLDELRTLPFLAPHRVVIISEGEAFIAAWREALEGYLQAPSRTGTLVLMVHSIKSNERIFKLIVRIGEVLQCAIEDRQDLATWLGKSAGKRGKTIQPAACSLLERYVGRDLASLDSEMEKLSLYVGDRPQITVQDVTRLVNASVGPGAFDLTNAITAGDMAGALKALDGMMVRRGEEFKTLGMLRWHLGRALSAQQALSVGASQQQALPAMPYEQRNAFLAMLKRRGTGGLLTDFRRLLQADQAMKSGTNPKAAMQELVVKLCR